MGLFFLKILVAATVISFASWFSGKRPILAGFIVALPLTSILALIFSQFEFGNSVNTVKFAKSIFIAVPVSLLFFIPFLLADKIGLGFWTSFICGIGLLTIGFFLHRTILGWV